MSNGFALTICIEHFPDMRLSVNGREKLNKFERAELVREVKREGYFLAKEALSNCNYWEMPPKARVSYEFYTNDRSIIDLDNLISACKPYLDSFVDAHLIIADNGWKLSIGRADLIFANQKQTRLIIESLED
jgi:hypothetical protein